MTNGSDGPLPHRAGKYITEHHGATPDEMLRECDLPESRREQVEHLCAVTRYGIFKGREANDAEDLAFNDVEWSDVADWDVSDTDRRE